MENACGPCGRILTGSAALGGRTFVGHCRHGLLDLWPSGALLAKRGSWARSGLYFMLLPTWIVSFELFASLNDVDASESATGL